MAWFRGSAIVLVSSSLPSLPILRQPYPPAACLSAPRLEPATAQMRGSSREGRDTEEEDDSWKMGRWEGENVAVGGG